MKHPNSSSTFPILSQMNPTHTLLYFVNINFNTILPHIQKSSIGLYSSGFPTKILYASLCSHAHYIVQNFFTNYKNKALQPHVKHFIWLHHLCLALICPFHASIHNFHPKRNTTCSNDGYTDRRIPLTAKTAVKDELPAELVAVHV